MGFCLTGTGATLASAESDLHFSTNETNGTAWGITSISGLGRSVAVIDNSDLSIPQGSPKKYCFANIHDLRPLTVGVKVNVDNTTIFPDGDEDQTASGGEKLPFEIGLKSDTTPSTPTNQTVGTDFVLTFPSTATGSNTRLVFSGAFIDDSGIALVNNDRHRSTLQIQPDGERFWWEGDS